MERRQLDVPFFPDRTDQCGPSALASVLAFWGHPVDSSALKKEVYTARLKGSLPVDLLLAAQNAGFKAHLYDGSLPDMRAELVAGHPLIAFLNRGTSLLPVGHYVVITGFDEKRQGVYLHSGSRQNDFVPYKRFSKDWNKTDRSTLLILPPNEDRKSPHAER